MKHTVKILWLFLGILLYTQDCLALSSPTLEKNIQDFSSSLWHKAHHNFESKMEIDPKTDEIWVYLPGGNTSFFAKTSTWSYKNESPNSLILSEETGAIVVADTSNFKKYYFDKSSLHLVKILTVDGTSQRTLSLVYSTLGQLSYVTDFDSWSLFFEYDSFSHLLTHISGRNGNSVTFSYRKIWEEYYLTTSQSQGVVTKFEYDALGNLLTPTTSLWFDLSKKNAYWSLYNYSDENGALYNKEGSILSYKMIHNQLYSVLEWKEIYTIDPQNYKRTKIASAKNIRDFYITQSGTIYLLIADDIYIYDTAKNSKKWVLLWKSIYSFIVDNQEKNIYYINRFTSGYYTFDLKTNKIIQLANENVYQNLFFNNLQFYFIEIEKGKILEKNPEFSKKYDTKLALFENKLHNLRLNAKWLQALLQQVKDISDTFHQKFKNPYTLQEWEYLFEGIKNSIMQNL